MFENEANRTIQLRSRLDVRAIVRKVAVSELLLTVAFLALMQASLVNTRGMIVTASTRFTILQSPTLTLQHLIWA